MTTLSRAAGKPATVDQKNRSVEAVISTFARVERHGLRPDGTYGPWIEELDPAGTDLTRFNGAPILLDHEQRAAAQVGVIESARIEDGQLIARMRFGTSELAEQMFKDVVDGVRRQVSCGYRVMEWFNGGGGDVE